MGFFELLAQIIELLQREQRVSYRALKREFSLDDAYLEDVKVELIEVKQLAVDHEGKMLLWTGEPASSSTPAPLPSLALASHQEREPLSYTPQHLVEKILQSRADFEGERKQVTVLFADIKDSTELIKGLDLEAAQRLLDPALHHMMDAVYRFEGTVNQVLGDGIMALFGAPIAHEDHALRACYAALATPGTIRLTAATVRLVEGLVQVTALGPVPVKGLVEPVEMFELLGVSGVRRRLQAAIARGLTRFVGRQPECDTVLQALARAEAGHGQVVAIVGEAGVGKSRLVYEVVQARPTQGWLALESASVSYGKATPYFPVIELLKHYVHIEDSDDVRTMRAKVTGQVLTLDDALQDTIPAFLSLLDVLPDDSPFLKLAPPQRRQGVLHAAIPTLEQGLAVCQSTNILRFFPAIAACLGAAYALAGRVAEALPLLDQVLERIASGSRVFLHAVVLTELSEALLLVGRVDEASVLAGHLLELARPHTGRGYQAHACRLLGDVAMHREPLDIDQVAAYYRQALTLAEEVGMRPLQAHCHLGLGTLYARTGQQAQAHAALSAALDLYRAMEMTFWILQAEAAL